MRIAVPLAALALATCASIVRGEEETGTADLPTELLSSGAIDGQTIRPSQLTLVRDERAFRSMLAQLKVHGTALDPGTVPRVDFDHWMVVAFFSSESDRCDSYRLSSVIARPDKITLHIRHKEPGGDCVCAQSGLWPYIIAKIPWTDKPIDFAIEPESYECR